jgi:K+-transporting ATPase ATPase C chain
MTDILVSVRVLAFFTLLTGAAYPMAVTLFAKGFFSEKASGQLVYVGEKKIGSLLIAQKFSSARYFWSRPSAVDYNPLPSGGSNLGQDSTDLKGQVDDRTAKLKAAHATLVDPPQDLLFASGSGVDPHISEEAAQYQIGRVAQARLVQVSQLAEMLESLIERPQLGFLGETRVNVLALNLELDRRYPVQ